MQNDCELSCIINLMDICALFVDFWKEKLIINDLFMRTPAVVDNIKNLTNFDNREH